MRLIIFHYHLRPGGIRRIIELATPAVVRASRQGLTQVTMVSGEAADPRWRADFAKALGATPVEFLVNRAFGYFSEQRTKPATLRRQIRSALEKILGPPAKHGAVVWAHNLGLARNLIVTAELARACEIHDVPLLAHHHDWWFDNRWQRWTEARQSGFRSLHSVADAIFGSPRTRHITINQADARILARHFPGRVTWLPNLAGRKTSPPRKRVRLAREWLREKCGQDAPVWLLPCRFLRRKNVAEALLLTRWLRPEAWLVTTGGVSSAGEQSYLQKLGAAAHAHHWRVRLGILAGKETDQPAIGDLLAASEVVLLTSIQEGFGLPYLEATAAERPLIARALPNIAPDLKQFGFAFPQYYQEILVSVELFDWEAERQRQNKLFQLWLHRLPVGLRKLAGQPTLLGAHKIPPAIPFSRLTLTAQLEILARPPADSWDKCAPLNPFLKLWRHRAAQGKLQVARWPRGANRWLGAQAYTERFLDILRKKSPPAVKKFAATATQREFTQKKLASANLYPLLWNTDT